MTTAKRGLRLLLVGVALAVLGGAAANILELSDPAAYMVAGALVALLVGFGVPWVLGLKLSLQGGHEMQTDKAAVSASQDDDDGAPVQDGAALFAYHWDEAELARVDEPTGTLFAGWAVAQRSALSEDFPEAVNPVGVAPLDEPILGPNGSGE